MTALDGVKIPSFTPVHAGPICTQRFGWFGADAVNVDYAGRAYVPGTKSQAMDKDK